MLCCNLSSCSWDSFIQPLQVHSQNIIFQPCVLQVFLKIYELDAFMLNFSSVFFVYIQQFWGRNISTTSIFCYLLLSICLLSPFLHFASIGTLFTFLHNCTFNIKVIWDDGDHITITCAGLHFASSVEGFYFQRRVS